MGVRECFMSTQIERERVVSKTSHVRAMSGQVIAGVVGAVSVGQRQKEAGMPFIHTPEGVEAQRLAVWLAR
jgi:hypothetical protein